MMQILKLIMFMLVGEKHPPANDLRKRKAPKSLRGLNWTFILLTLALVLFFICIWIFQIGNSYPNDLMNGSLNI